MQVKYHPFVQCMQKSCVSSQLNCLYEKECAQSLQKCNRKGEKFNFDLECLSSEAKKSELVGEWFKCAGNHFCLWSSIELALTDKIMHINQNSSFYWKHDSGRIDCCWGATFFSYQLQRTFYDHNFSLIFFPHFRRCSYLFHWEWMRLLQGGLPGSQVRSHAHLFWGTNCSSLNSQSF